MRVRLPRGGFSQIETLCVIGCIAAVLALLGGANWHVQTSMQLRTTATEFLQTVKTARQYAVDHRCRTRIAFRAGLYSKDAAYTADEKQRTYRILAFIIPSSLPGDAGRWVAVPGAQDEARTEWARVELTPRSVGLVGRWMPCELDPHHRRVSDAVKISSPLFERFDSDEREVFFADNFHTPEATWLLDVADPHEPGNCFSVFPEDYRLTPVADPLLFTGKLPENEKCLDPITGEVVEASTFWSGETQFIRGVNGIMEELPGIEFRPDGSLACIWTRELEVRFAFASRPHQDYVVLIDTATGLARIEQAEVR